MRAEELSRLCAAIAIAASLAGCSGWSANGQSAIMPQAGNSTPPRLLPQRSWIRRGASQDDLMYAADANDNTVDVYTYPAGTPAGSLTGFVGLADMCVDGAGDVFIPSYGSSKIFVYAHGGTKPIRTLDDPRGVPYSCAVDPKTGDLAVANYLVRGGYYADGDVVIYRHAKGQPQAHLLYGWFPNDYFCAYDNAGNLFVEGGGEIGSGGSGAYVGLEELPRGARLFTTVTLQNVPAYPNGLQWFGNYLAVGTGTLAGPSSGDTYIYHMQISHFVAKTIGVTQLKESGPTANFFVDGSTILASGGEGQPAVNLFPYPKGGAPTQTVAQTSPYGVVVSAGAGRGK